MDTQTINNIISGVAGGVIVLIVTEIAAWIRGKSSERKQRAIVERAILAELQTQKSSLQGYKKLIDKLSLSATESSKEDHRELVDSIDPDLPEWHTQLWQSHMTTAAGALSMKTFSLLTTYYNLLANTRVNHRKLVTTSDPKDQALMLQKELIEILLEGIDVLEESLRLKRH